MNSHLDEGLVALAEHTRRFAADQIAPGSLERDKSCVLVCRLMWELGDLGLIAPELPTEFGGRGLSAITSGVIHEKIARWAGEVAAVVSTTAFLTSKKSI